MTCFLLQFDVNKHEYIFAKTTKLHEPIRQVKFIIFEKFKSAYLYQIARGIMLQFVYNEYN